MLLEVDCLPNAVGKQPSVHTLDLSWKKMDVKLMMMMMMMMWLYVSDVVVIYVRSCGYIFQMTLDRSNVITSLKIEDLLDQLKSGSLKATEVLHAFQLKVC